MYLTFPHEVEVLIGSQTHFQDCYPVLLYVQEHAQSVFSEIYIQPFRFDVAKNEDT